jgi:hypothetical protein
MYRMVEYNTEDRRLQKNTIPIEYRIQNTIQYIIIQFKQQSGHVFLYFFELFYFDEQNLEYFSRCVAWWR